MIGTTMRTLLAGALAAGTLVAGASSLPASAGAEEALGASRAAVEARRRFNAAFEGKTIAFVPITMGVPLTITWKDTIEREAGKLGMKFVLRDPNLDMGAMTQAVSALIGERPDVMVVHNPSVQLLAKLLKKAEKAGIHVVQINMASNTPTSAYVGADFYRIGKETAEDIVTQCGAGSGRSGKVAIVEGDPTSSVSMEQVTAAKAVFAAHPDIQVVSSQPGYWDANKAREITASVLTQHPDLCATYGVWGIMQLGAGQAIKEAGLTGKVLNYSNGGGPQIICDSIKAGLIDKYWSFDAKLQGHDIMTAVKMILQSGAAPGDLRTVLYSDTRMITAENADGACWQMPGQ